MSRELQNVEPPAPPLRPAPRPAPAPHHHKTISDLIREAENEGFARRHRGMLIAAAIVILGLATYIFSQHRPSVPVRRAEHIVMVQPLSAPPPRAQPPPPPPRKEPPPAMKERQIAADEQEDQPRRADNPPPAALATGIRGDGPGIGLASSGNGLGGGSPVIGGVGGGRHWGGYKSQVQSKIAAALHANSRTRTAVFSPVEVHIWPDATGRITQVKLARSTGDSALDDAVQNQVLTGLQLPEAPPADMPLPIVLRISAGH